MPRQLAPGLAEFVQSQQAAQQGTLANLQTAGTLAQLTAAADKKRQEEAYRQSLAAATTPEEQLAVASKYVDPKTLATMGQAHQDRVAQREAQALALKERLAAQAQSEREKREAAAAALQAQLQGKKDMMQLAASLRPPPPPRNVQLTTDAEGNQLIVNADGTTTPLSAPSGTGGVKKPVGTDKPPTDVERVSAGYASRMAQSEKILTPLEAKGIGTPEVLETAGSVLYGGAGKMASNLAASKERQSYRQAQEDWVRAKLRKESGAVIADEEMDREIRVYFPQIGDSDLVKSQKRDSRKVAEKAMLQAAGRAPVDVGVVRIKNDEEYNALKSGTQYLAPDGSLRTKK